MMSTQLHEFLLARCLQLAHEARSKPGCCRTARNYLNRAAVFADNAGAAEAAASIRQLYASILQ